MFVLVQGANRSDHIYEMRRRERKLKQKMESAMRDDTRNRFLIRNQLARYKDGMLKIDRFRA